MGLYSPETEVSSNVGNTSSCFRFISPALAFTLAALLSSCADMRQQNPQFGPQVAPQPQLSPGWHRITWDQWYAAQIQLPDSHKSYNLDRGPQTSQPHSYPPHAGNPPQQNIPQKYPIKPVQSQKGLHRNIHNHTALEYTPEYKAQLIRDFGYLYNNPNDATKKLPNYMFINLAHKLKVHVVQQGETFSGICRQNKVDRRAASLYNHHIPNLNYIKPDYRIFIPEVY